MQSVEVNTIKSTNNSICKCIHRKATENHYKFVMENDNK